MLLVLLLKALLSWSTFAGQFELDKDSFKYKLGALLSKDGAVVGFDETVTEEMARDAYYYHISSVLNDTNTNNNNNGNNKKAKKGDSGRGRGRGRDRRRTIDASTSAMDDSDRQSLLDYHNNYRISLASGDGTVIDKTGSTYPTASDMNFLFWDDAIASVASDWANDLAATCGSLSHNSGRNSDFYTYADSASFSYPDSSIYLGENVAATWTSSSSAKMSYHIARLNQMWAEQTSWSYQTYSSSSINGAGHFTQLAWADTRYLGCGVSKCYDGTYYRYYLVCDYWPGGNYANQYPYTSGTCTSGSNNCDGDRSNPGESYLCGGCMDPDFVVSGSVDNAIDCENGLGVTVGVANVAGSPSQAPTEMPIDNPTEWPSNRPTNEPSNVPSNEPSNGPTNVPSDRPTNAPTDKPSNAPSNRPSNSPSHNPTDKPTIAPSNPTLSPTSEPSNEPSNKPSNDPSKAPSEEPTSNPSNHPSNKPSNGPTNVPTHRPSSMPTNNPIGNPSESPTDEPTTEPSYSPSHEPTIPSQSPTHRPSNYPSNDPTSKPSSAPTNRPSNDPSKSPTDIPTDNPSNVPTNKPSYMPTDRPSNYPTRVPSDQPSNNPSNSPTNKPSGMPTDKPSNYPSTLPTNKPSNHPSTDPSNAPSKKPTIVPTANPVAGDVGIVTDGTPITIRRSSESGNLWYMRLRLEDVNGGLSRISNFEIQSSKDGAPWESFNSRAGSWDEYSFIFQGTSGYAWQLPYSVRITSTDGYIIEVDGVITSSDQNSYCDVGANFVATSSISSSDSTSSSGIDFVTIAVIGSGLLVCILIISMLAFKRCKRKKTRMNSKGNDEDIATTIEISKTRESHKETDVMTPRGVFEKMGIISLPPHQPHIVGQASSDIVYAGDNNNNDNDNDNDNEEQSTESNQGTNIVAGGYNDNSTMNDLVGEMDESEQVSNVKALKRPRVKSIHIEETMTYYSSNNGKNKTNEANGGFTPMDAIMATPTNGAIDDDMDNNNEMSQIETDINAPFTPIMNAMKGYQTEELSLSTNFRNNKDVLSPTGHANVPTAIMEADSSDDDN